MSSQIKVQDIIKEIDDLNESSWLVNRTNPKEGLDLAEKALELSKKENYEKGKAFAYKNAGSCLCWLSRYDESIQYAIDALQAFKKLNLKSEEAQVEYIIGTTFYYLSDYDNALKHYVECHKLYEEDNNIVGIAESLNGIGSVYYSSGENEKAISHLSKSYEICKNNKAFGILPKVLDGLGNANINLKKYKEALSFMEECIEIIEKNNGNKHVLAYSLNGIGKIHFFAKDYNKSLYFFEKSLKIRQEIKFKVGEIATKIDLSEVFLALKETEKAKELLFESLMEAESIQNKDNELKAHLILSEIFENENNALKALEHFKKYDELKELVRSEKSQRRSKSIELNFILEQEVQEKKLLEIQHKELQKKSEDIEKLSSIGYKITSLLSIDKIIETVYDEVNQIMEAPCFGIGILNETKDQIVFPGYIENGKVYENIAYDLTDKNRLAIHCFTQNAEILIGEYFKDVINWVPAPQKAIAGDLPESVIYLPLFVENEIKGVISVQSFNKNVYSDYHLNMVRNLGVYVAIAIQNAAMYEKLEEKVDERTEQINLQKDKIEKTLQVNTFLSEIGQKLTASTDFNAIFYNLFQSVNQLMDAACFGVRLYKSEQNIIEYKFEIEKGALDTEPFSVSMDDIDNYSVWCVTNNKEIVINDNLNEYHKYTSKIVVPTGEMPHSLIFYPMTIGEKIIGVITVQSFEKFAYTQDHINILKTLSSYTAIALENANLVENLEEKVAERTQEIVKQKEEIEKTYENTQLLSQIGRELTTDLSIQNVIEKIYKKVNDLMDASIIGVGIINFDTNELEIKGAMEKGKKLPDFSFSLDEENQLAVWSIKNAKEILINDFDKDYSKYFKTKKTKTRVGESPESILYIPLVAKNKVIGTISVQSFNKNAYNEYHLNILRNLALYASTAIENANLYNGMEIEVKKRTQEVVKQKEEIEKTYNNTRLLSEIGQEIISSHDLEDIFVKLQNNVNQLMDATCFSIRLYNPNENTIDYKYIIEKGERLAPVSVSMDNIDNYSVWCVTHKKDIFINDHAVDYKKYTKKIVVVKGDLPDSLIFCPMMIGDKVVGVISAQSFEKNAYTYYHLDILRTLASYTAIALENVSILKGLEDTVLERTQEVVKQKEEIEKSYVNTKLLSEIGREISTELNVKDIIAKVYDNINNLMDAVVFGIALFREETNDLYFSGAIEKGNKLDDFGYLITDDKIATRCFNNKEEIIINDWLLDYKKYVKKDYVATVGEMPESMVYLPLITKEKSIGVLTVQSFEKNIYNEYHIDILRNLSVYIANAIENAALYQSLEERVIERTKEIEKAYQDTKLLSQISKDISESLSVEKIIESVYHNINTLMDATSFGIGIYNDISRSIKMPGFIEKGVKMEEFEYFIADERLATVCFNQQREIFINDYSIEYKNYIKGIQAPVSGKDSASIIYLPLFLKEKIFGVITVQSYEKNVYTEYHLDILRNLANTIATALENAILYENLEEKVKERTAEVVQQKEIIEEKNKDITDSIKYAQRIQNVILPPLKSFQDFFKDSFILFKPRDIVSGDFYWMERIGNKVFFSVVDCTGHGVPGALVSIVGANGLNRCLVEFGLRKPSDILDKLSEIVTDTFDKDDSGDVKDGMDMSLCCLDLDTNELQYSGANNPIWILKGNEIATLENIIEIKGDKQPIGKYFIRKPFTNHVVQLETKDRVYLFSDGFADQFGGEKGKKFKYGNLKRILIDIQNQPMVDQYKVLETAFEKWKGEMEQIDDICFLGIQA